MKGINTTESLKAFERLLKIMDELREQCPWDKKQTLESLRILTIEETYELADAINNNNINGLKEEIGDMMLHLAFYTRIAREQDAFDMADVLNDLCEKLIRRHPHIYGEVKVENEQQVKQNWEQIKLKEKGEKKGVLDGVPKSLPAIVKAYRIQEKAKQVGFEWENTQQVWNKVEEEIGELKEAVTKGDVVETEKEFGDVLFSLVNYSRFIKTDPEAALEKTNIKFKKRFERMEQMAVAQNKSLQEMTLMEMDALWNETKKEIR